MAGVSDRAFRVITKSFGAGLVFSEMISAKGITYNNSKTASLLAFSAEERPFAVQLFGGEPAAMAVAVSVASLNKPDIIDINAGCPVQKVTSAGAGSALLKDRKAFANVITAAVGATEIPVTVKLRTGWDSEVAPEFAHIAEDCGASAVTIHARTKEQLYEGKADWDVIARVKQKVRYIPVIGNGDVHSAGDAARMMSETGCDLVMIGRGALGRPWIFSGKTPMLKERISVMEKHVALLLEYQGERVGMRLARKHAGWYMKGLRGAAHYRGMSNTLATLADFRAFIAEIEHDLSEINE